MRSVSRVCAAVVLFQVACTAQGRPTIAVLDFTAVSKAVVFGEGFSAVGWSQEKSGILSADLVTALVGSRKFDVLERDRMEDVLREKEFVSITGDQAIRLGTLLGAEYFVMGQIELLECAMNRRAIPYSSMVREELTGRMVVNLRIVDTRGGKVVSADKVNVFLEAAGGMSGLSFFEALKDKTVAELANGVVDGVFPVKVAQIQGGEIYLSRGEGAPFSVGTVMAVYAKGVELIDPDTGESLGSTESEIARVKVSEILQKFSKALVTEGSVEGIAVGQICRPLREPAEVRPAKPISPGSSSRPIQW
jgi:curli biogenesis system outer membrane secretion channel CsgG